MRLRRRIGLVASAIGAITRSRNTLTAPVCVESSPTARCGTNPASYLRLRSECYSGLAGLHEEGHRLLEVQLDLRRVMRQVPDRHVLAEVEFVVTAARREQEAVVERGCPDDVATLDNAGDVLTDGIAVVNELEDLRRRLAHAAGDMPSLTADNKRRSRFVVIMAVATLGLRSTPRIPATSTTPHNTNVTTHGYRARNHTPRRASRPRLGPEM
jgi:hypothetical protein